MNKEELAMLEWQYDCLGPFKRSLMKAICCADEKDLELLEKVYPAEVGGYRKYSQDPDWWLKVKFKAKSSRFFVDETEET